jgi:large subunit ribosomal protein L10
MLNRREKEQYIDTLKSEFQQSQASFLVHFKGLSVSGFEGLRNGLRKEGARIKVAKNTLLTRAVKEGEAYEQLKPHMQQETAIVFSFDDPVSTARVLKDVSKENEGFKAVAGVLDDQFVSAERIEFLGGLPSREQLLGKFCGALKMPMTLHVGLLNQVLARFVRVLKQASEKQS